jgi:calcium-dependent protein kinase
LATHKLTNQKRAIKVINKRNIKSSELRNKFINEISVLKMIDHPNIIKLYEFFEDDSNYYLVTDYLSGGELLDYILKNKVLSEKITAKYIKQALESVAYLHSKNIVHRDIKLENLMLESNEPNALLKLIDFGTSIISSPFKKLKTYKGTISYLSPEVFENKYNEKCDLWSIGVIMYILLSGKMPFGGRDEGEIIRCITKGSYNMKGREWVKISPHGTNLLKKLLNPNPKLRISASAALSHPWFAANIQEP